MATAESLSLMIGVALTIYIYIYTTLIKIKIHDMHRLQGQCVKIYSVHNIIMKIIRYNIEATRLDMM